MDEKEIVKLFLGHGFQLSETALPLIKENPQKILSQINTLKPRPFIITKEHVEKITETKKLDKCPKIELLKKFTYEKKELKAEDYVKHFSKIYEKIKEILLKNTKLTKLVSINKITWNTKEFSLIFLVRKKGPNNLLAEDPTGETNIFFEDNMRKNFDEIGTDDVLGIVCKKNEEKIYAKNIIYPGVSITREINKASSNVNLYYIYKPTLLDDNEFEKLSDILRQTRKIESIFIFGGWNDRERLKEFDNTFLVSEKFNPELFGIENVKILGLPETDSLENILDKRLIKGNSLLETFVIEDVPDIILSSGKETYSKNYKGTTIISNNDRHKIFIVNLKTREAKERKL